MKIAVVVTARPSWAKLQPVCEALRANPEVELQIVACASALLERYGKVVDVIKRQFTVADEVYSVVEGETVYTAAQETGGLLYSLSHSFRRLRPDVVVVMADRHEVLAVAQAASYTHCSLAHCQGGEKSGSIDDRVRDAITALADYHFTSTELARYRVVNLTGAYDRVWNTGCPSIDIAKRALSEPPVTVEELGGAGASLYDYSEQGALYAGAIILQHPVTNEANDSYQQMRVTIEGCTNAHGPVIAMWPGQDAGAAGSSKAIRESQHWLHTVRNLPPSRFLKLLTQARVLIGNSSAGIRECSYLGVPVVNIGTRQWGRERAANVIDVPHDSGQIAAAIEKQIAHGRYPSDGLYGRGDAGQQIADKLMEVCSVRVSKGLREVSR